MLEKYQEFMSPKEVAEVLGANEECIRYMIRRGTIPAKKVGCHWYVAKEWLSKPDNQKEGVYA